jgi:hypothetical protein
VIQSRDRMHFPTLVWQRFVTNDDQKSNILTCFVSKPTNTAQYSHLLDQAAFRTCTHLLMQHVSLPRTGAAQSVLLTNFHNSRPVKAAPPAYVRKTKTPVSIRGTDRPRTTPNDVQHPDHLQTPHMPAAYSFIGQHSFAKSLTIIVHEDFLSSTHLDVQRVLFAPHCVLRIRQQLVVGADLEPPNLVEF